MLDRVIMPNTLPRGEVTVKLIDAASNKVIEEVKANNKIGEYAKQLIQLWQRELFFRRATPSINRAAYDVFDQGPYMLRLVSGNFRDGQEITGKFDLDRRAFVLDNAYSYENLKTVGQMVGYAYIDTYSGSDTRRGGLNLAESFAVNNRIHFVFDFPTNAANGTISALGFWRDYLPGYTHYSKNGPVPLLERKDALLKIVPPPPVDKGLFAVADDQTSGDTYMLCANGQTSSYGSSFELYKFSGGTHEKVCDVGFAGYKYNIKMTVINGVVFIANSNNIFKVMNGVVTRYSSGDFGYFNRGFGRTGGYLYGLKDNKTIVKVDPASMSVVESFDIGSIDSIFSTNNVQAAVFDDRLSFITISAEQNFYVVDLTTRRVLSAFGAVGTLSDAYYAGKFVYRGLPGHIGNDSNDVYYHILEPFSFVNLPSPIVKTSAQTMKIEYDFIFEF